MRAEKGSIVGFDETIRNRLDRGRYRDFETRWDDRLLRAAVLRVLEIRRRIFSTWEPAPESSPR